MVRQILSASSLRESDRTFLAAKGWVLIVWTNIGF